jgi:predicted nucleic acid-binding protein
MSDVCRCVGRTLVRRVDLGLRAPDAINIAIAQRCGAHLLTFDAKMARSARTLGVNVVGERLKAFSDPG